MIEPCEGHVTIAGYSSASVSAQDLRRSLNIIPQDPYFFPGSIRANMLPDNEETSSVQHEQISKALRKVGLYDKILSDSGADLDSELHSELFSAGQLQLLSLARAMLKPKGILILDEATSK